jgi:hypothetical protein
VNRYVEGRLTVRADGSHDLKLGEVKTGAILRGRAVTKMGNPYKNPVYFRLADEPGNVTAYWAEPYSEGRFEIQGIVPKSRLTALPMFTPADVFVGEAGSETVVDLTGRN